MTEAASLPEPALQVAAQRRAVVQAEHSVQVQLAAMVERNLAHQRGDLDLLLQWDRPVLLGFKRSSQHKPALLSATRQMPRQVFAIQASCAACR